MSIVTLSDALITRLSATDGRILRDRVLCGLCLKLNKRTKTFLVATSCRGKQVRVTLGRWPLISTEEARKLAMQILLGCRKGDMPREIARSKHPTVAEALNAYAAAKRIKPSSLNRYSSILRTHFAEWQNEPATSLGSQRFSMRCTEFSQMNGSAVVAVGRGLFGALIRYINSIHNLNIENPFSRLAGAGLLPPSTPPRLRKLEDKDLPQWRQALEKLPALQRDYLLLIVATGLRRNEGAAIRRQDIDLTNNVLHIPETKNGKRHILPITPHVKTILMRRCAASLDGDRLFPNFSADHVTEMAERHGSPRFTLHDLRKLLATTGKRLGINDAILRRILNHTDPKADVLHRHYVHLTAEDILRPLVAIEEALHRLMHLAEGNTASLVEHKA